MVIAGLLLYVLSYKYDTTHTHSLSQTHTHARAHTHTHTHTLASTLTLDSSLDKTQYDHEGYSRTQWVYGMPGVCTWGAHMEPGVRFVDRPYATQGVFVYKGWGGSV